MTNCSMKTKWNKVSRQHQCPICGKPDWCLYTGVSHNPDAVICARIESSKRVGTKGAGWLHQLRDDPLRPRRAQRRFTIDTAAKRTDFGAMASECEAALGPLRRGVLAEQLGVTADSLARLQVGWSERHRSFTFPMREHMEDGAVRGIRLRRPDGSKWAVLGSKQGLFAPRHFLSGDTLFVCEGPTDTAAILGLGFDALGRPSCSGGAGLIVDLVADIQPSSVAIIADRDGPGQRGARSLAARLVGYVPAGVRIVTPPPPAKDAREWVRGGATRDDVLAAIEAAPLLQLRYGVRGGA